MSLSDDIRNEIKEIFKSAWTTRIGEKVPEDDDLKLSNDGVELDAVVLYADLAESTKLVTDETHTFAAEVYKAYLKSACRIIRANDGRITAFDGDRVMAVFFDGAKNTNAAKSALQINGVVEILNEELKGFYKSKSYVVHHAVGVDASKLLVARTGIRGSNDLVWVGIAANRAAKLSAIREHGITSWITGAVYSAMLDEATSRVNPDGTKTNMWTKHTWKTYNIDIYGSAWWWKP